MVINVLCLIVMGLVCVTNTITLLRSKRNGTAGICHYIIVVLSILSFLVLLGAVLGVWKGM